MHTDHTHHGGTHPSGHPHDRGMVAALRYARLVRRLWRSEVNAAVVRELSLRAGEQVVDLGAGAGAATVEAVATGAHVLAVDPMPFMRAVLRLRRLSMGASGTVEIRSGAAESIPAEDHSVDALWTVNTLHHWTDRAAAARELARVLKPGARFLLLDEDFDDATHPQHQLHRSHQRKLHFDEVDPVDLAATLERAGIARAEGAHARLADRPVKWVHGVR